MQHVLILTKNALAEEHIVNKLERMNCEILCSTDLLERLQQGTVSPFISYFQWVFLSESLCNSEVEQILQLLKNHPLMILRIEEGIPEGENLDYWKELGLAGFISKNTTYEALRETIHELELQLKSQMIENNQILSFPKNGEEAASKNIKLLLKSLSKTEKKVFEQLMQAYPQGGTLSRQEMCEHLWKDGSTSSNMSQLSCLINKLKNKIELHGYQGESISTLWGRGYKFSSDFYDYWIQCSESESPLFYMENMKSRI